MKIFDNATHSEKHFGLDIPCTPLDDPTPERMLNAWQSAPRDGVVPVILVWDDNMEYMRDHPTPPTENPDLDAYVKSSIDTLLADEEGAEMMGREGDEAPCFDHLAPVLDEEATVVLAQVPADKPWQIFRHVPFGGWNACPDSGIAEAFLKRWYERFGAVPVTVRGDMLELIPARRPQSEEAYQLALEMFAFCEDIIMEETETIHALADSLTKSDIWGFWWD